MRAIILAAGVGSRLYPLTKNIPKQLVKVAGMPIIDHQIKALEDNGITNITIVVGYLASILMKYLSTKFPYPKFDIRYVYNMRYKETNTAYSLWLTSPELCEGTFLLNGDVLITPKVVAKIHSSFNSCLGVVPRKCQGEEVKVILEKEKILDIGKGIDPRIAHGEYVGIAKLDNVTGTLLSQALRKTIENNGEKDYYDHIIKKILPKVDIKAIDLTGLPVLDIDTNEDLKEANKLLEK